MEGDLFFDPDGDAPDLPDVCRLMENDNWFEAGSEDEEAEEDLEDEMTDPNFVHIMDQLSEMEVDDEKLDDPVAEVAKLTE